MPKLLPVPEVGTQISRWTVIGSVKSIRRGGSSGRLSRYLSCRCECGTVKDVMLSELLRETVQSCGCIRKKEHWNATHGASGTRLYAIWHGMWQRCRDVNHISYPNYGGRGIKVCDEWQRFEPFRDWAVAHGYAHEAPYTLNLDRRDNEGDYTPENCRWISHRENTRNMRRNVLLAAFGETKPVCAWAEDPRCMVAQSTLYGRIAKGWDHEQAIKVPGRKRR